MRLFDFLKKVEERNKEKELELIGKAKDYVFRVGLQKVLKRLVLLVGAALASERLRSVGVLVELDPDKLFLFIYGLIELLRNYLKQKFPKLSILL